MSKKNGVTLFVMLALAVSLFYYFPANLMAENGKEPPIPVVDTLGDTTGTPYSCQPSDDPGDESLLDVIIDIILGQE